MASTSKRVGKYLQNTDSQSDKRSDDASSGGSGMTEGEFSFLYYVSQEETRLFS